MNKVRTIAGFLAIMTVICALCAGEVILSRFMADKPLETVSDSEHKFTLVIDAGHGGIDGGAVSASGKLEKDFNLAVAKKLEALCARRRRVNSGRRTWRIEF